MKNQNSKKKLAPRAGLEPATQRLTATRCRQTEGNLAVLRHPFFPLDSLCLLAFGPTLAPIEHSEATWPIQPFCSLGGR
jgi:hypothetical protein